MLGGEGILQILNKLKLFEKLIELPKKSCKGNHIAVCPTYYVFHFSQKRPETIIKI